MKNAFFCSTPYQVLVAINIKMNFLMETTSDIYILNHLNFQEGRKISTILDEKLSIFNKVKYVDCINLSTSLKTGSDFERYRKIINAFRNVDLISQKYFNFQDSQYDEVYFSTPNKMVQLATVYLYKKNKKLNINLFEDGLGGYTDNLRSMTWKEKIFQILTGSHKIFDYNKYYLFKPELYSGAIKQKKLKKIPPLKNLEKDIKHALNKTFTYTDENNIKERVILFEQPIEGLDEEINTKVINCINESFGKNFIIKPHPRSKITNKNSNTLNTSIPWEILVLNSDIENKILISYFSTALTTNKMVFNEEPYLIFLFNLAEVREQVNLPKDLSLFLKDFSKEYQNKEKIFIPGNLQELSDIVIGLNEEYK